MKINSFARLAAELDRTGPARRRGVPRFKIVLETRFIPLILAEVQEIGVMEDAQSAMEISTLLQLVRELRRTLAARNRGVLKFNFVFKSEHIPVILSQMRDVLANRLITEQTPVPVSPCNLSHPSDTLPSAG